MAFRELLPSKYKEILKNYLDNQTEKNLYLTQILSKQVMENNIAPEEVISLHRTILSEVTPEMSDEVYLSFDILMEFMMAYGFAYRENQSLRCKQMQIKMELDIGAKLQKTMLGTKIPQLECLDIGAVSMPANVMNGDYYHFVMGDDQILRVAIADIIGKGIPAALCMSMIKHAMDSLSTVFHYSPNVVLESLNRTVEKNINPGMFITMFYGSYDPNNHIFQYASAGHEPGFIYEEKTNRFLDLETKGLILGVDPNITYVAYEREIHVGDMIVLLSDGVTEARTESGFLDRQKIVQLLEKYKSLKAQEIVNNIYKELEKIQNYKLKDDFTMIILKREV